MQYNIQISQQFKENAVKTIFSITLFVITYIVLIVFAFTLTVVCGYLGFKIIASKPSFITLVLGAGLALMGSLVLIFLFTFIFKKQKRDLSHLIEIHYEDEPKLFNLINEIVEEVQTSSPKKVYLSGDVNASVFYDSTFWSMFFPIKKNLEVGLGLINSCTVNELKATIAHELGHFSQRSMKIGSYVYNVNQIIYNLLFDNSSFEKLTRKFENFNSYITLFVAFAVKIIEGIQWILKLVYKIMNLSYAGLSRQMEFHADEFSANVAGSDSAVNLLKRLSLSSFCYDIVLKYFNDRISESIVTENIYTLQTLVMDFMSKENDLKIENGFPKVEFSDVKRFNRSKLNVEDQWASHPGIEERVHQIFSQNIVIKDVNNNPAGSLLKDFELKQKIVTENIFSKVEFPATTTQKSIDDFRNEFIREYEYYSYNKIYNHYYEKHTPSKLNLEELGAFDNSEEVKFEDLFSDEKTELALELASLSDDLYTLKNIAEKKFKVKSYDYAGMRYYREETNGLIAELEKKKEVIKETLEVNDKNIYKYFYSLAGKSGLHNNLKIEYQAYFDLDNKYEEKVNLYNKMMDDLAFIPQSNAHNVIEKNFFHLKDLEKKLKTEIKSLLASKLNPNVLTTEIKATFNSYLSNELIYFSAGHYIDEELTILYKTLHFYPQILSESYYSIKKELLDFQASLINN